MFNNHIRIRQLDLYDIPFAMELKNIAGWNQTEEDWKRYIALEPDGCFLAEVNGEKVGTGIAISYDSFGWIGMILVHPSQRRNGLGTELLRKTIAYLQDKGVDCIKLDATPIGKQVYIPLGFKDEYEVRRYERKAGAKGNTGAAGAFLDPSVLRITTETIGDIAVFDEYYFGASRTNALRQLWRSSEEYSYYVKDERGIVGFIMAHHGFDAVQIGPWEAKDAIVAGKLFTALIDTIPNEHFLLDLPCFNREGVKLMRKYGFHIQRGFYRMYLGDNHFPGNPQGIYATSGAEKG